MIGHGSEGPVGAESLGQAGFTSLPAGTGSSSGALRSLPPSPSPSPDSCSRSANRAPLASAQPLLLHRRHRLGALPLALVPPMSDSDSRTEKRKVNSQRFAIFGAQAGDGWKRGASPAEPVHLSLVSHVRAEALVCHAWRAAAGDECRKVRPRFLPGRAFLGKGRGHRSCGYLAEVWLGSGCRTKVRHLSRAGRARRLGLEPRTRRQRVQPGSVAASQAAREK